LAPAAILECVTTADIELTALDTVLVARRAEPWTPDELKTAIKALAHPSGILGPTLALALPSEVAPAIAVNLDASTLTFRGHTMSYPVPALESIIYTVVSLVEATRLPSDLYADPLANPASWPRLLRSGVRRVLFSATELFGLPFIAADPSLPDGAVYGYLDAVLTGRLDAGPARCIFNDLVFDVVGELSSVHLTLAHSSAMSARAGIAPEEFGHTIARELGASMIDLVELHNGEIDYLLDVGKTRVVVTAGLEGGSAAVGYRGGLTPAPIPEGLTLPEGWLGLGPATSEPGWVALHRATRIRALCTLV
jgi:hypothetical protein